MLRGLTSTDPRATRLLTLSLESQLLSRGAPASTAALATSSGPSGSCTVMSTKAVLIDSAVARRSVTVPYCSLNSLRTGMGSPGGVNVSPFSRESSVNPLRRPATVAKVLKVEAVARGVVAQLI